MMNPMMNNPMMNNPMMAPYGMPMPGQNQSMDYSRVLEEGVNSSMKPKPEDDKLTKEEREQKDIAAVYQKVRVAFQYKEESFILKLKEYDTSASLKMHQNYVFKIISGYGVNLLDYEKKLLLTGIEKVDDQIFYFDLVHKLFPERQIGIELRTHEDLVQFISKKMKLERKSLKMIFLEFVGGDVKSGFISLDQFKGWFTKQGIVLTEDKLMELYSAFDVSKDFKVQYEEFREAFLKGSNLEPPRTVIEKMKGAMTAINKNTDVVFTKYKETGKMFLGANFTVFFQVIEDLQLTVNVFEAEQAFDMIDVAKEGFIKLETLRKFLDAPPTIEVLTKDAFRKAVYKTLKNPENGMKSISDLFNFYSEGREVLKKPEFVTMLKSGIKWTTATPNEINAIYKEIDDDNNMFISAKELADYYNENRVSDLFPFILAFKVKLREKVLSSKTGLTYIFRESDEDGDGNLNLMEFKDLLRKTGVTGLTPDDQLLIFREIDRDQKGKITCPELRLAANSYEVINVIELTQSIRANIRQNHWRIEDLFNKTRGAKDSVSFIQFFEMVNKELNLGVNILEAEELFDFIDSNRNSSVDKPEMFAAFEGYGPINPFLINPQYMKEQTGQTIEFYNKKYKFDEDTKDVHDAHFSRLAEPGTNSSAMAPIAPVVNMLDEKYGEVDLKFISRLRRYMKSASVTIQTPKDLFQIFQNEDEHPGEMMYPQLEAMNNYLNNKKLPESQLKQVFAHLEPTTEGVVKMGSFIEYFEKINSILGDAKEEARKMIPKIQTALIKMVGLTCKEPLRLFFMNSPRKDLLSKDSFIDFVSKLPWEKDYEPQPEDIVLVFESLDISQKGAIGPQIIQQEILTKPIEHQINLVLENALKKIISSDLKKLGERRVLETFYGYDMERNYVLRIEDFKEFLRKERVQIDEDGIVRTVKLALGYSSDQKRVPYITFMQEMDLITRQRAAELTMNSKAKSDKDKVYEMVHYLEVFCKKKGLVSGVDAGGAGRVRALLQVEEGRDDPDGVLRDAHDDRRGVYLRALREGTALRDLRQEPLRAHHRQRVLPDHPAGPVRRNAAEQEQRVLPRAAAGARGDAAQEGVHPAQDVRSGRRQRPRGSLHRDRREDRHERDQREV
jgi:Ca2+-binding EF-hand superfamily protein